jgi:hypothetical protein
MNRVNFLTQTKFLYNLNSYIDIYVPIPVVVSLYVDYLKVTSHGWFTDHKYKTTELRRS